LLIFPFSFRLCAFDPHELFEQIDASGRQYVEEIKSRLATAFPLSSKSSSKSLVADSEQSLLMNTERISQFVTSLLDEYDALNRVCQRISIAVAQLVSD
jgi:hypothetical protein